MIYAAISCILLILSGILIITIVSNTLTENALQYQYQAIVSMGNYIKNLESHFGKLLYNASDKRYTDITTYLATPEGSHLSINPEKITNYLNTILNSHDDIIDVILVKSLDEKVLSISREARTLVFEYDFKDKSWYRSIKEAKKQIAILPHYKIDYIRSNNYQVLTYACNIYNDVYGRKTQDIGTLIVNYKVKNFSKALRDYNNLKGSILLCDRNDFVIFDVHFAEDGI